MNYCEQCKKLKHVVGFDRDNPILSCGHIKEEKSTIANDIESYVIQEAIKKRSSVTSVIKRHIENILEIIDECEEKPTIGTCKVCGTVSIYYDKNNIARCGGDMINNPGCGMPIHESMSKNHDPMQKVR